MTKIQKLYTIIMIFVMLILAFTVGYIYYRDYQDKKSYHAWFYENSVKVYDKDYHIDNKLVPFEDNVYIKQLQVGDDVFYIINKKTGNHVNPELILRKNIIIHQDEHAYWGHEFIPYPHNKNPKEVHYIISVPNINIKDVKINE